MTKIPPDDVLESLYKLRIHESDQLKKNRIGIVRHGNLSEDIEARLSEIEHDGEETHGSETSSNTKIRRQKREN